MVFFLVFFFKEKTAYEMRISDWSSDVCSSDRRFVFSSTAAVYGEPDEVPVGEAAPTRPASPYGASKLLVEWMLRDVDRAHGLRHVILTYFNVAGADPLGRTGPVTPDAPPPHQVRSGERRGGNEGVSMCITSGAPHHNQ